MLGLGWPESAISLIVALLIFGPKKIPELGSSFGKSILSYRPLIVSRYETQSDCRSLR